MNFFTSTGYPNFTKHLTNKDSWLVPKMFYITSVNTPYKNTTNCKERLHMYCSTVYARSGVYQMWILKNSKELLENLKSPFLLKSTA
jgi:hypothetical protein